MGSQKTKEAPPAEKGEKRGEPKERAAKKWKGKEWFVVTAPEMFGEAEIGEIPATDPQSLIGRNLEVSLADLGGNPNSYYIKLMFKITGLEGDRAVARFNGLNVMAERIYRIVRKRTSRVEVISDVETKDGWQLHVKILVILNRVSDTQIQRKIRLMAMDFLKDFASKSPIKDFVQTACDELIQKNIKKFGSKVYPIRFCEVARIQVRKAGT